MLSWFQLAHLCAVLVPLWLWTTSTSPSTSTSTSTSTLTTSTTSTTSSSTHMDQKLAGLTHTTCHSRTTHTVRLSRTSRATINHLMQLEQISHRYSNDIDINIDTNDDKDHAQLFPFGTATSTTALVLTIMQPMTQAVKDVLDISPSSVVANYSHHIPNRNIDDNDAEYCIVKDDTGISDYINYSNSAIHYCASPKAGSSTSTTSTPPSTPVSTSTPTTLSSSFPHTLFAAGPDRAAHQYPQHRLQHRPQQQYTLQRAQVRPHLPVRLRTQSLVCQHPRHRLQHRPQHQHRPQPQQQH
mmetsp:Transcript_5581/g.7389  ORF Transcript_5581/g.7389 Transcript_5581/m.7389 type:complete len:298 (-) Transcript_5581:170-1063(-)